MLDLINVNWLAIIAAAVINMILGAVWYSPILFGNHWMKLTGVTKKTMRKGSTAPMYLGSFLTAIIMSFVLGQFLIMSNATVVADALRVALWAWVGFIAPYGLTNMMFQNKPPQLFLIDSGYYLVSLLLMAVVLFVMG